MRKKILIFMCVAAMGTLSGCSQNVDADMVQENITVEREADEEEIAAPDEQGDVQANEQDDSENQITDEFTLSGWLTLQLPEGYTLSEYSDAVGFAGGALIEPQAYEVLGEDSYGCMQDWTMSGFIGLLPDAGDAISFEDGQIAEIMPLWNHSSLERLETLEGLDMPAVLYHVNHDLYTAADLGELEEQGTDISEITTTSDYWYIFFADEGKEDAYYLALDQNQFTKEEAVGIAETVKFLEK